MRQSFWVALSLAAVLIFPSALAQSNDPVDPPLFGLVSLARGFNSPMKS